MKDQGIPSSPGFTADVKRDERGGCTNASLEGAYGSLRTGHASAGLIAAGGLVTYDGAGN